MTKREREDQDRMLARLLALGFTIEEFRALRRISMTLRRWYEAECNGEIERGGKDGLWPWATRRAEGVPYASCPATGRHRIRQIPDREAGARNRLAAIMAWHKACTFYLQTDPRGCALYIIPKKEIRAYEKRSKQARVLSASYPSIGIPIY